MSARILKPLDNRQLFDETFDIYKKNFKLLAGIVGIVYIPISVLSYGLLGEVATIVIAVLTWPLTYLMTAACTWAISRIYLGHDISISEAYSAVSKRLWPFIWTSIIAGLIVGCGFMLLVIPGVIFSFWFVFVSQVFILEGLQYSDARQRSRQLAAGIWGRIFVVALLSILIQMVIAGVFAIPAVMIAGIGADSASGQLQPGLPAALMGLVSGIGNIVALPIGIAVSVLLYYDVRVRKEGFDLELLAVDMATRSQSPSIGEPVD
jgi:hypothetical protein